MPEPKKKNILLVEDETLIALMEKRQLEKAGYAVVQASSGESAVQTVAAEKTPIDLILMDIDLGEGMDGTEAALEILRTHEIPVLFLSSHTEKDIVEKTEAITNYGYVVKNSSFTVLDASIKMAFKLFAEQVNTNNQKETLQTILHSIGDAIIATDIIGNITQMNPVAEKLTGWRFEEKKNKPLSEAFKTIDARTRLACASLIEKTMRDGETTGLAGQTILLSKDGTEYRIADSYAPIKDIFGAVTGVVLAFRDVTGDILIQEGLRKSEYEYRSTVESLLTGVVVHDSESRILICNREASRILGLSAEQMAGKDAIDPAWMFVHEDLAPMSVEDYPVSKVISTKAPLTDYLLGVLRPDRADVTWVNVNAYPLFDDESRLEKVVINFIDISARKRAYAELAAANKKLMASNEEILAANRELLESRKQLAESELRFNLAISGTGAGLWDWDIVNDKVFFSPRWKEMLGYEDHEVRNDFSGWRDLWHPEDAARIEQTVNDYLAGRTARYEVEHRLRHKDGGWRWILTRGDIQRDQGGKPVRWTGTNIDITERKMSEASMRGKSEEQAWLLKSMMNAFVLFDSVFDSDGVFISYRFRYINDAYERITGVKRDEVYGKTVHEVWPGTEASWIENYGSVAMTGVSKSFDMFHEPTAKLYRCTAYRPWDTNERFCVVFDDITEQQRMEQELKRANEELASANEELAAINEELMASNEEIRAANQELLESKKEIARSEAVVRGKLKALVEPEGDLQALGLSDILDSETLQSLMNDMYAITGTGIGIIDTDGKVLVATGWQDICTKFHRCNPETLRNCIESDIVLADGAPAGTYKAYRCKNNMWDISTPIILGGRHVGNIFLGQFVYDDEQPDLALFRDQARRYGFDETEYLAALARVPRWSRETVDTTIKFYSRLAVMISDLSFGTIRLAKALAEKGQTEAALRENQFFVKSLLQSLPVPVFYKDVQGRYSGCNQAFEAFAGRTQEQIVGKTVFDINPADLARAYHTSDKELLSSPGIQVYESKVESSSGELRNVIFHKASLTDADGSATGIIGAILDITERKRAEEKVKSLLVDKELILKEVHHRIKNYMNTIYSLLFLQAEAQEIPAARSTLLDAADRVQSMLRLYDKLYRSEGDGSLPLKKYLPDLIDEILKIFPRSATVQIIASIDDIVYKTKVLSSLSIILNELITNSMKYAFTGRNDGAITITCTRNEHRTCILYEDDGPGLPATVTFDNSTGFGMQLVQMMIQQLRGAIYIDQGKRSRIIMEIPA